MSLTYEGILEKQSETTARKTLADYSDTFRKNAEYFMLLLENNCLAPGYVFRESRGKDTFELVALAVIAKNWEHFLADLEYCSNIGVMQEVLQEPDLDDETRQNLLQGLDEAETYLDSFMDNLECVPMKYSQVYRSMRDLFSYKGNMSTVKRVCEELATWGWLVKSNLGWIPNPDLIPYVIDRPLDFSGLHEDDEEDEQDEDSTV